MRRSSALISLVLLCEIVLISPIRASATTCESLSSLSLPNTTITSAESIAAGAYMPSTQAPSGGGGPARGPRFDDFAGLLHELPLKR